jgi:uncharacterized membrane protein
MLEIKNELSIEKPVEFAFNFITHFENIPLWNYYVKSVEKVSANRKGTGTIYHQIRKNDDQRFKISRYDPPRSFTIETIGNSNLQFRRTISLKSEGDQTHILDKFDVDTGAPNMVERVLKNRMKSAVLENLTRLKELLEKGNTVLQDGRVVNINDQSFDDEEN